MVGGPAAAYVSRMVPLSVLDLAPIVEGGDARRALHNTAELARRAEGWGYRRIWFAEHHNMPGVASAATALVIAHAAAATSRIRVGAGGIMLPNHSPLVIAEQFGTLASLYPGRIDLGLGRAPGTDQLTLRALRRDPAASNNFPQDVQELQAFLAPVQEGQRIQAVPGGGTEVPLWILGSSTFGAQLAAALGLPYAFASHFAPDDLLDALEIYRAKFEPSEQLARPHAMVGVTVVAAETDAEALRQFTSIQQRATNMLRGYRGPVQPPVDDIETYWTPAEKVHASRMLQVSIVGGPSRVREGLERLVEVTKADELMVVCGLYDHEARKRSYEILAKVARSVVVAPAA
jgi:luciferase family oxidoreductase group 1